MEESLVFSHRTKIKFGKPSKKNRPSYVCSDHVYRPMSAGYNYFLYCVPIFRPTFVIWLSFCGVLWRTFALYQYFFTC